LYTKGELRRKRREIPGRAVEEGGEFSEEFSEGDLRRGESSRRGIFVEGNLRYGACSEGNFR
jgi:hypothetical protein